MRILALKKHQTKCPQHNCLPETLHKQTCPNRNCTNSNSTNNKQEMITTYFWQQGISQFDHAEGRDNAILTVALNVL